MKAKTTKRRQGASLLRGDGVFVLVENRRIDRLAEQALDQASQNSYVAL